MKLVPVDGIRRPEPMLTARGRATRERIVATATQLMYEHGVAGTSLDDVRAGTGTSKSQLYHYFADKSALVQAVIERQAQLVMAAQQPELDQLDSLAALHRWRDRVVAINSQRAGVGGCPLGRLASELVEDDPRARVAVAAGFERWRERLAAGLRAMQEGGELVAEADPDQLALGVLGAVQGGLVLAQTSRSLAPLAAALDLALDGIRAYGNRPRLR